MKDLSKETRQYVADVICVRTHKQFGILLKELLRKANIKQDQLEERSEKYRDYLVAEYPVSKNLMGGFRQSAISRIVKGIQIPTYGQVYVWVTILQQSLSEEGFPESLQDDMYYLVGYVPPRIIMDAYARHAKEQLPKSPQQ